MKILVGGKGKMGSLIKETAEAKGHTVLALVDANDLSPLEIIEKPDVIIDFSHRDNLKWISEYMSENSCALVYGTTGLEESHFEVLDEIAKNSPVFYSANFSYGVASILKILEVATKLLKDDFDMELVEIHHNQKVDAPSGTAKAILKVLNENNEFKEVYGRNGMVGKREKEIGIHSLRGGTEAGEHSVFFYGDNEAITISHRATNRQIFVNGAIQAAQFIINQEAGMYSMEDLLGE